jgi:hypothetical protein
MKGQFKIEFILALAAFILVLVFIIIYMNDAYTNVGESVKNDTIKMRADSAIIYITEDPSLFAIKPYYLNLSRIAEEKGKGCENIRNATYPYGFRLRIFNSTDNVLDCGAYGSPVVSISRNIKIVNNTIVDGNLTLDLW